jgi:hypothetical protein
MSITCRSLLESVEVSAFGVIRVAVMGSGGVWLAARFGVEKSTLLKIQQPARFVKTQFY